MTNPVDKILCPLDTKDVGAAVSLARDLKGYIGGLKIGLEFFTAAGPSGYDRVAETGMPIFLDLKFHDIPNTVAGAVYSVVPLGPMMLNVHASGGPAMLQAAAKAADKAAAEIGIARPKVLGVTVLTSLEEADLAATGVLGSVEAQVVRLARLSQDSGLDGVVCSSHEIAAIRRACGEDFTLVVPGIRPKTADVNDQKRIMTPPEAVDLGADYLVIGRAITQAADPVAAARAIANSLQSPETVA